MSGFGGSLDFRRVGLGFDVVLVRFCLLRWSRCTSLGVPAACGLLELSVPSSSLFYMPLCRCVCPSFPVRSGGFTSARPLSTARLSIFCETHLQYRDLAIFLSSLGQIQLS
jgi:hypothetical protein